MAERPSRQADAVASPRIRREPSHSPGGGRPALWCITRLVAQPTRHRIRIRCAASEDHVARRWTMAVPERRSERVQPRAVKLKMSNYDRKRPGKSSSKTRAT
jgi:hypothetical protein